MQYEYEIVMEIDLSAVSDKAKEVESQINTIMQSFATYPRMTIRTEIPTTLSVQRELSERELSIIREEVESGFAHMNGKVVSIKPLSPEAVGADSGRQTA